MNTIAEVPFFIRFYPYIIAVLCVALGALYLAAFLKKQRQKRADDRSPKRSTEAVVMAKREELAHTDTAVNRIYTQYFVTFEDLAGNRTEVSVTGREYGMLAEGDRGQLSIQGSRFLGFERFR